MTYCTLFDKNYLDKGIVMIDSLQKYDRTAEIFVLCMDDFCKYVLDDYYQGNVFTIALPDFEDDELLSIKEKRSAGEYCWTCTAKLIKYLIERFDKASCTYVDSDLCFYSDPKILIDEMRAENCSVQLVSHRFLDNKDGRRRMDASGRNCVQFNTFDNSPKSMELLDSWIKQCLEECSVENIGDQKYTDGWGELDFVNVTENIGAGIAPWNLHRYKMVDNEELTVFDRYDKKSAKIVFYHYQNVINLDRMTIRLNAVLENKYLDKEFIKILYIPYLYELERIKRIIEKRYNFLPLITKYISEKDNGGFMATLKRNKDISFGEFCLKVYNRIYNKILTISRKKIFIIKLEDGRVNDGSD